MPTPNLTIVYADTDQQPALQLAEALQERGYVFTPLTPNNVLIAVISPGGLQSMELRQMLDEAFRMNSGVVLAETQASTLPEMIRNADPVRLSGNTAQDVKAIIDAIKRAKDPEEPDAAPLVPSSERTTNPNGRLGILIGLGILGLFGLYTVAIALFDIEAPQEEFEELYTRDAMTINAFAQEYIPLNTEQAESFEITLEGVNDELATLVVATATQAATEGGFTPIATGLVIESSQSEARQTATGQALQGQRQTDQADISQDEIALTATSAAATANAELNSLNQTVTAAADQ